MIERIKSPSISDFFARYVRPCRPVVVTDLANDWPAISKWTPSFFQKQYGDVEISIRTLARPEPTNPEYFMDSTYSQISLSNYFQLTKRSDSPCYYLCDLPLSKSFPSLMSDVRPYPYITNWFHRRGLKNLLWIGPRGTVFPAHMDVNHNFHTQIYGKKRWRIWPPTVDNTKFFGIPSNLKKKNFSNRNLSDPANIAELQNKQINPVDFILSPGETLFLPGRYIHFVEIIEYSISINSWWNTLSNRMLNLPEDLQLASKDILLDRHPPVS